MIRLTIKKIHDGYGVNVDIILDPPLVVGPLQYARMCERGTKEIAHWCTEQWGDPAYRNGWTHFAPTQSFFMYSHDRAMAMKMRWDGASYAEFL